METGVNVVPIRPSINITSEALLNKDIDTPRREILSA